MLFPDYTETKVVYHVAPINDLDNILKKGIRYDDKFTYESKYLNFHKYIDSYKPNTIPNWVIREKAIFASLNFDKNHQWHSHSVIMAINIDPSKCWVANENLANELYEPFILKDVQGFECAKKYIYNRGKKILHKYWTTSLSFIDNLKYRRDKEKGYDAEVLVFDYIPPEHINILAIVSDHKIMTMKEWKRFFCDRR
ncbi:hypothetical protein [Caldisalinibacter kiritimatiensis]|uniref:DarT domain-containing protein n=1 Tax=Caldisalinibacter kiritimatiensis TaxID=1304284 RepID=R1CV04_9FIRM|nr:hypothetical protein [Caldisalinibacter kiritimatiensis]EOD00474.1 hypothetical protein L21TH_1475 [Caldisalinibacter kiritimatiensis]